MVYQLFVIKISLDAVIKIVFVFLLDGVPCAVGVPVDVKVVRRLP